MDLAPKFAMDEPYTIVRPRRVFLTRVACSQKLGGTYEEWRPLVEYRVAKNLETDPALNLNMIVTHKVFMSNFSFKWILFL